MIISLYINNDKLDLFKDESIKLNSSITDLEDITKNTTDYTKTFSVPASYENNRIFKHYYDFNIDGGFDARTKVAGRIELDGVVFKTGKFRLNKVIIKGNEPQSYSLNFWGNLVSFKDIIGDDELSDLDLSAYDHPYTSANVKLGLTDGLSSGNLVYTLLTKRRLFYNSNPSDAINTLTLGNIAFNGQDVGIMWNELKPSLKVARIFDAIQTKYGFTFNTDFLGRAEFENLYLYLSNNTELAGGGTQQVDFDGGDATYMNLTTNIGTYPTAALGGIDLISYLVLYFIN